MKVSCYVETAAPDSRVYFTFEIDDASLNGLTAEQRNELIDDACRARLGQHIDWDWEASS